MGGKVPPGLTIIQANLSAKQTIDVSSHGTTLSFVESAASSIVFTGALSSDMTFQIYDTPRTQRIVNSTTGSYLLFVKRGSGGAAYLIPQGETLEMQ